MNIDYYNWSLEEVLDDVKEEHAWDIKEIQEEWECWQEMSPEERNDHMLYLEDHKLIIELFTMPIVGVKHVAGVSEHRKWYIRELNREERMPTPVITDGGLWWWSNDIILWLKEGKPNRKEFEALKLDRRRRDAE